MSIRAYPRAQPCFSPLLCSASLGFVSHMPRAVARSSPQNGPRERQENERTSRRYVRADCKDAAMEIEIGRGKKGRRAYGFDDIAIVPSRRTRDPDDIDISWKLGPYQFELPMLASAMDGVVSPETAGIIGGLGGLAVLNLEGIFTRYEDADEQLERIASLPKELATREMQDIYREPVKPELIAQRIREIKEQKVVVAASLTPQRVLDYHEIAMEAGLDVLVIQGTVVSGEHVSTVSEPLNLKEFIPTLDVPVVVGGCASYHTSLHLMRTGAAGVRGVLAGDRRRRYAQRRGRVQGDRTGRRRGDDRLAAGASV